MKEITVYMEVAGDSVIAGAFQFSNPYWDSWRLASVKVHGFTNSNCWGITISGCDDGGIVFVAPNYSAAMVMFGAVIGQGEINVDALVKMGFEDDDSAVIGE